MTIAIIAQSPFTGDGSDMMDQLEDLAAITTTSLINEKTEVGNAWIECCERARNIPGMKKLIRKINAKLAFLKKLEKQEVIPIEQVSSSNLAHLQAIAHTALTAPGVVAVLQSMTYSSDDSSAKHKMVVDVIADHGNLWIKVVARNEQSLSQIYMGEGHFGEKNIVEHAKDYWACSGQNLNFYRVPTVQFSFYKGVGEKLSKRLERDGIAVRRHDENLLLFPNALPEWEATPPTDVLSKTSMTWLNLDVSCMIAYVSALTNGACHFQFKEDVLTDQASRERTNPVKPQLDLWCNGRELLCCETAECDFRKIVNTIGGAEEKERARQLLERLTVVKDQCSPNISGLRLGGQIKKRSLVIFGTGESLQTVTVTANAGFIRAAQSQGKFIAALVHESRALSEAKETTAEDIKFTD